MRRRSLILFFTLLLSITTLLWGIGQSWGQPPSNARVQQNQLKEAENAAAALRKSTGQMRSTTNDDKRAAAERNATRRAAVDNGQGTGGGK